MRRFGILALLVGLSGGLFGLFAAPQACLACSCIAPGSPTEELARAAVVFRGRVTAIATERAPAGNQYQRVTFQADTVWKGSITHEVAVYTSSSSASCGYPFMQGEEYLVYASRTGDSGPPLEFPANALAVSLCSRTSLVSEAGEDFAALGPGSPVTASPLPNLPNTGGGHAPILNATLTPSLTILAVLVVLLLGAGQLRRRV